MEKKKVVGIDLGTTNSVVSILESDEVKVIINPNGTNTTPSVVAYTDKKEILVGTRAKNQAVTNPSRTISSIKRFMGLRIKEVSEAAKQVSYKLVGKPDDLIQVDIDNKHITPQEISATVLRDLKKSAEAYLGEEVTDAVITVPAYFSDSQRQATKEAGKIAGLNVLRIINEPTAAALAFGFKEGAEAKEKKIAVFDLGGGTFDISILEIGQGIFQVLAINGDTLLGGDDFDAAIVNYVNEDFQKNNGIDLKKDLIALQRLREAAEKAKCELSTSLITTINLPFITVNKDKQHLHLNLELSRAKFESLIREHMRRIEKCCKAVIEDSNLKLNSLDEVILVGGSTRVPLVQDFVKKFFGKEPNKSVNPDEVVSRGAAIQGAILNGEEHNMVLLDVIPLSVGIEIEGGRMDVLIPRNTTIPTAKKDVYTTAEDLQEAVDVNVFQGERKLTRHNRILGTFRLDGIPPARKGVPKIEVTFDIDADGILKVAAKDLGTGNQQHITIQNSSNLSEEEIKRMHAEAEQHATEDQQQLELIEVKNHAEQIISQTEHGLKEFSNKLSETEVQNLTTKKDALIMIIKNNNKEEIIKGIEDLMSEWQILSTKLYSGQVETEQK